MNRAGSYSLTCLLLLIGSAAQAVPVSFRFSSVLDSTSTDFPLGAQVAGSFTIETDVATYPAEVFDGTTFSTIGLFYWNPVLRYDLDFGGQLFSFVSTRPSFPDGIQESSFAAFDRPEPSSDPTTNYDLYQLDSDFGAGQLGAPNDNLHAFASLIRTEFDLSVIESTDMLLGLTTTTRWDFFFTIFDPETGDGSQVHGIVTNLQQVIEAPEPGTVGLFIAGLGMLGLSRRRRR